MLLTNLLQQIYSIADTAIVGRALGDNALGAVGNIFSLSLLITGFSMGVTGSAQKIINVLNWKTKIPVENLFFYFRIFQSPGQLQLKLINICGIIYLTINLLERWCMYGYLP
ncbi:MAG: MATE family efflux transporter [Oscillospiraceae bacterium]|nr:MATE family efflux transporter [Oscillospiraceae bacterium]